MYLSAKGEFLESMLLDERFSTLTACKTSFKGGNIKESSRLSLFASGTSILRGKKGQYGNADIRRLQQWNYKYKLAKRVMSLRQASRHPLCCQQCRKASTRPYQRRCSLESLRPEAMFEPRFVRQHTSRRLAPAQNSRSWSWGQPSRYRALSWLM